MADLKCGLDLFACIMLLIVLAGSVRVYKTERSGDFYLGAMIIVEMAALLFDALATWFSAKRIDFLLYTISETCYFICYYALLVIFIYYITDYISARTQVNRWFARISFPVGVLYAVLWSFSSISGLIYQRNPENNLTTKGSFYVVGAIGGYFITAMVLIMVIKYRRVLEKYEIVAMLSFMALPFITACLRLAFDIISTAPLENALALLLVQNFMQYNQALQRRRQREELTESRMRIMMSQIAPHFIYNVLNTIYFLCDKDSESAKEAIDTFSEYLRMNFSSIEKKETIPIEKELEHVRLYLKLEKMRFADKLDIEFETDGSSFFIPPLTIEPLVENAVKHGITKKDSGGKLSIDIRKNGRFFEITVSDNGVGFDTGKVLSKLNGHVGIANIRERLLRICEGELIIESRPEAGTKAVIRLPERFRGKAKPGIEA